MAIKYRTPGYRKRDSSNRVTFYKTLRDKRQYKSRVEYKAEALGIDSLTDEERDEYHEVQKARKELIENDRKDLLRKKELYVQYIRDYYRRAEQGDPLIWEPIATLALKTDTYFPMCRIAELNAQSLEETARKCKQQPTRPLVCFALVLALDVYSQVIEPIEGYEPVREKLLSLKGSVRDAKDIIP